MQRSMNLLLFQEIIFEGSTSHKKKKSRKIFEVQITITKEKAHIFCVLVRRQLVKRKKKVCSNFSENLLYFGNGVSSFRAYSEEKLQHFKQNFIRLRTKI